MDKKVYELTADDFIRYGAWFFPMDDTVEDELTVRPLQNEEARHDYQIVVRTEFFCADGARYLGYLYWDGSASVNYLKPVMFMGDGSCLCFWSGIVEPAWDDYPENVELFSTIFPIAYASGLLFDMPVISGTLEGLYYLGGDAVRILAPSV